MNEDVTFTADVDSRCDCVEWSGGGDPATADGICSFVTKWATAGVKNVSATSPCDGVGKSKSVTVVTVAWAENAGQTYGYDGYTSSSIPWKSVKVSGSDTATANISGPANSVYFKSLDTSAITVSPSQASSLSQAVTFTGVAEDSSTDVWARLGSDSGQNVALIKLAAYNEDSWSVAVRVVHEDDDDVQVSQVGNGKANTDAIDTGSDGICGTTASSDDVQLIPIGNGQTSQTAITAGSNSVLDTTPSGDDSILGPTITTGANGVCNTTASGDDVQQIPTNQGKPNTVCIDTGADGVCDTIASGNDGQMIAVGDGKADEICITAGTNTKRDTNTSGDDGVSGEDITTGSDGICDTTANGTDKTSTDPYTASALETYLNGTIYNQSIVKWTVTKLSDMTVNFDLDRDGYIDVNIWTTAEMDVIINQCDDLGYNYIIFVVNNPNDGSAVFMSFNQRRGFIHPGQGCTNMEQVTAHELGHGFGGLYHTPSDTENLMYNYCGSLHWRLRNSQWSTIQAKK